MPTTLLPCLGTLLLDNRILELGCDPLLLAAEEMAFGSSSGFGSENYALCHVFDICRC